MWKADAAGNTFVLIEGDPLLAASKRSSLCRQFNVDGLIFFDSKKRPLEMHYFNSDGGSAAMCGNGARALNYLVQVEQGIEIDKIVSCGVEYLVKIDSPQSCIFMKEKKEIVLESVEDFLLEDVLHVGALDTGVPHLVLFSAREAPKDFLSHARSFRQSTQFREGANINWAQIIDNKMIVTTYERGVEGLTLSCGTGLAACFFLYKDWRREGLPPKAFVTAGGEFKMEAEKEGVWIQGPMELWRL